MNIGLDFHDTISYCPEFFKALIAGWAGDVYIVTGTPPSKRYEVEESLSEMGIHAGDYKDILCGYEYEKSEMDLSHFKRMAKHKLNLLKEYNIEIFYDDNPYYVDYVKDHGIKVFQPVLSSRYLQEFAEADPFFTCNLQKMQFDYLASLENDTMTKERD
tara:strand:- start:375 stop:851 length:477 start_codon:yes stop_codon:yes gene_type:complete